MADVEPPKEADVSIDPSMEDMEDDSEASLLFLLIRLSGVEIRGYFARRSCL